MKAYSVVDLPLGAIRNPKPRIRREYDRMSPLILRIGLVVCLLSSAIAWWRYSGTERATRFVAIWLLVGAAAMFVLIVAVALLGA